ncbi:MAG: hypothetical protein ACHQ6V_00785 [Myxococcota bacterium]
MRALAAGSLLLALACASPADHGAQPTAEHHPSEQKAIPADLLPVIEAAERRGREMYKHDQAAWHATNAVRARKSPRESELMGWITLPDADAALPRVHFYGESAPGSYASQFDVSYRESELRVVAHDPAVALEEREQELVRARGLAIAGRRRQRSDGINTIVLRDAGGEIHVYLMAATAKPDALVLAGHDLARISPDGRTLLEWRPLSATCVVSKRAEGDRWNLLATLNDTPTETDVFTELSFEMLNYFIVTRRGLWRLAGGEVFYFGESKP